MGKGPVPAGMLGCPRSLPPGGDKAGVPAPGGRTSAVRKSGTPPQGQREGPRPRAEKILFSVLATRRGEAETRN